MLDLLNHEEHETAINAATEFFGEDDIDLVLICHGSLPDQEAAEQDFDLARREIDINGLSVISLLTRLTPT